MALPPVVASIEISRNPDDVFAYASDPATGHEWQGEITSTEVEADESVGLGTRWVDTRRSRAGRYKVSYEVTEFDPPRRMAFKSLGGPLSLMGSLQVEPVDERSDSRVTIQLRYEGRGIGKLLMRMAQGQSQRQIPKDLAQLKQLLESGTAQIQ